MTKRIFKNIFAVSLGIVVICFVLMTAVLYSYSGELIINQLKEEAVLIENGLKRDGASYLGGINNTANRITIIESDGTVTYDSKINAKDMENHLTRKEIKEAFLYGESATVRYSETLSAQVLYYALKMDNGSVLRISSEQTAVWLLVLRFMQPILVVLIILLILSAVTASCAAKKILKPINELDLENPENNECYEEVAPLLHKISRQNKKIKNQLSELKRTQYEFGLITDNMSEGLIVIDENTEVLSYNKSAMKLLNAQLSEANKSVLSLNRSLGFRNAVELSLKGQHNEQSIILGEKHYNIIANPVFHNEKVTGAILIIFDSTEKESREQLRREFTSNVSHELKTPLTTIYGVSDMLSAGMVKPEDVSGFAMNIRNETGRLIELIDDIINLSMLDEGSYEVETEEIDLYSLADIIVERLNDIAAERNITLKLSGEHIKIKGVIRIVDEIFHNLVDNAIKYNKDGGKVKITVTDSENNAKIVVEDTGIGIPLEYQNRVFERFYRVDKSHSKKIGGTGLGLSIVKHAVMCHGGNIELESREGEGTKITVSLPITQN